MTKTLKKYLLLTAGSIALVIGIIGVFLPVLPTTPLLLISAYCYLRSSERMYNWLIHHRILGAYIYNYLKYKAVPRNTKIGALVFLWLTLTISFLLVDILHVRIFLVIVGIGVSIHLFTLKTLRPEDLHPEDWDAGTDLHRVDPRSGE